MRNLFSGRKSILGMMAFFGIHSQVALGGYAATTPASGKAAGNFFDPNSCCPLPLKCCRRAMPEISEDLAINKFIADQLTAEAKTQSTEVSTCTASLLKELGE